MESQIRSRSEEKELHNKLLEPSLENNDSYKNLSSYNLNALFVLSFLGGLTPNIYFSLKNAKKLKLDNLVRKKMCMIGLAAWLCMFMALGLCLRADNVYAAIYVAVSSRFASFGLYIYYYKVMRAKYKAVKFFEENAESTVPIVICWAIIGYKVELLMGLISGIVFNAY